MYITEIRQNKLHRNKLTGRTASIYGATPHGAGWEVVSCGFTFYYSDGTVRSPYYMATAQEAIDGAFAANMVEINRLLEHGRRYPATYETCRAKADAIPVEWPEFEKEHL